MWFRIGKMENQEIKDRWKLEVTMDDRGEIKNTRGYDDTENIQENINSHLNRAAARNRLASRRLKRLLLVGSLSHHQAQTPQNNRQPRSVILASPCLWVMFPLCFLFFFSFCFFVKFYVTNSRSFCGFLTTY